MNTLAVNQTSTLRWDFQQDVQAYAERGFEGIGLYRRKLDDVGLDAAIDCLAEASLQVTSLSWAGGFTGSDGRGFQEAVNDGMRAITEAANVRAETLVVLAGGRNNHIRRHARRTLCDALARLAVVGEEFGVRLSLEPIHAGCGNEWSFVNDLDTVLDVIHRIGSPNLGIALDTYHVGMNEDVFALLPDVVPHLNLLQLGDGRHSPLGEMNRCLLGEGCVPLGDITQQVIEAGYEGPIEVEVLGEDVESMRYEAILDHAADYLRHVVQHARS